MTSEFTLDSISADSAQSFTGELLDGLNALVAQVTDEGHEDEGKIAITLKVTAVGEYASISLVKLTPTAPQPVRKVTHVIPSGDQLLLFTPDEIQTADKAPLKGDFGKRGAR